jgi:hypothetical protein
MTAHLVGSFSSQHLLQLLAVFSKAFWLIVVLSLIVSIAAKLARAKKQRFLFNEYVQRHGFHFVNPEVYLSLASPTGEKTIPLDAKSIKRETEGLAEIREFQESSSGSGFYFDFCGHPMTIFAHSYMAGNYAATGRADSSIALRVAKLHWPGLPEFRLERVGAVSLVEWGVSNVLKAAGQPNVPQKVSFSNRSLFSKRYIVFGKVESEVRSFFTDQKLAYLESNPSDGILATTPEFIVYFETGRFTDEAVCDVFISRAEAIFKNLFV